MKTKAIQSANLYSSTAHAKAKADAYGELPAHSPLPWFVHDRRFVADKDGAPVVNMGNPNKLVAAANAEYIVKVVNLTPEMVEALELFLKWIDETENEMPSDETIAKARRVLLKAKGSL
jgi:hypothetical protein